MSMETSTSEANAAIAGGRATAGTANRVMVELPSGRHHLSPEFVYLHQRERLLRAISEMCAERGYQSTTIAGIVRHAGVSSRTFYKHYSSKQECFLAAYRTALAGLHERLAVASQAAPAWPERVAAGVRELLNELAAQPALARTLFVDVLFAGPEAQLLRQQTLRGYQRLLPLPPHAPPGVAETVVGGVVEMIYHTILEDRTSALPGMYDELLYCLLVPVLGHEEAVAVCSRVGASLPG
jgi:AcrR family transcriptional regulator